jgi:hypothetical protein
MLLNIAAHKVSIQNRKVSQRERHIMSSVTKHTYILYAYVMCTFVLRRWTLCDVYVLNTLCFGTLTLCAATVCNMFKLSCFTLRSNIHWTSHSKPFSITFHKFLSKFYGINDTLCLQKHLDRHGRVDGAHLDGQQVPLLIFTMHIM